MRVFVLITTLLSAFLIPGAANGQSFETGGKYEFGAGGAFSYYTSQEIRSSRGNASVGLKPGFGASAWLGHNMYRKISGEVHYDFGKNDLKMDSSAGNVSFGAHSHALHYDLLFHTADTGAKVRPYFLVGGGAKLYRGTGRERAYQPGGDIAVLTRTYETKGLLTFGGGVKFNPSPRLSLRVELRDNVTQFPREVIAPVNGVISGDWIHNFVALFGAAVVF
jgi:hypothetical protein